MEKGCGSDPRGEGVPPRASSVVKERISLPEHSLSPPSLSLATRTLEGSAMAWSPKIFMKLDSLNLGSGAGIRPIISCTCQ